MCKRNSEQVVCPWLLQYTNDLVIRAGSREELMMKLDDDELSDGEEGSACEHRVAH